MLSVVFVFLSAMSAAPSAEVAEQILRKGERQAAGLEYDAAFKTLQRLVQDLPESHPVAVRARLSAGCVAVVLARDDEARAYFSWVLERNPDEILVGPDSDSPKIRNFYRGVRNDVLRRKWSFLAPLFVSEDVPAPQNLWFFSLASTTVGAISAVTGTGLALWHDGLAGERTASNYDRRQAQQSGRIWLGVGISGTLLGAAGLAGMLLLPTESE